MVLLLAVAALHFEFCRKNIRQLRAETIPAAHHFLLGVIIVIRSQQVTEDLLFIILCSFLFQHPLVTKKKKHDLCITIS